MIKKQDRIFRIITLAQGLVVFAVLTVGFFGASVEGAAFTVTNTANSGAGSLRQAITDLNAACAGGSHTISFAIPASEPAAVGNGNGKVTNGSNVYYRIVVTSSLPALTCPGTTVDGTTQPNTNLGDDGSGGTVGIDNIALPKVNKPEIEIIPNFVQPGTKSYGLEAKANNITIKGLSIYGFGMPTQSANVGVVGFSGLRVENNYLGSPASGFTDPGAALRGQGNGLYIENHQGAVVKNNLIGYNYETGIHVYGGNLDNNTIEGNEIKANNRQQFIIGPGIGVTNSTSANNFVIKNNLIWEQDATSGGSASDPFADFGIEFTTPGTGVSTIENNTITKNGSGMVISGGTTGTVQKNIIYENDSRGIMVYNTGYKITRNSFFANTNSIAIDNQASGDTTAVTINDSGDADSGGANKLNFPVLSKAEINGTNLVLQGFARPGSVMEFYIADVDPTGFGEGDIYLVTKTEGAADDTDTATGSYGPGAVLGVVQGSDTTNRFAFSVPVASLTTPVTSSDKLTAIAFDASNNTSEFAGNVSITTAVANSVIANNDSATTNVNTAVNINVVANDSDPQGHTFTVNSPLTTQTTPRGTVVCLSSGICTYTPQSGYVGSDSFNYTIVDSLGATANANVTITISQPTGGGNPPPNTVDARDDSATTNKNTAVNIRVLTNDVDAQGDTFTITTPLTATKTPRGTATCVASGACTYTPELNFIGTDTFNYSIRDSRGAVDTALVTVVIRDVVQPPPPQELYIDGYIFFDNNNNGEEDDGDEPASGVKVKVTGGTSTVLTTDEFGEYNLRVTSGTYRLEVDLVPSSLSGYKVTTDASSGLAVQNVVIVNTDKRTEDVGLYKPKAVTEKPRELAKTASEFADKYFLSVSGFALIILLQFLKSILRKLKKC